MNSALCRGLMTAAISGGVVLLGQGVAHADDHSSFDSDRSGHEQSDGRHSSDDDDREQRGSKADDDGPADVKTLTDLGRPGSNDGDDGTDSEDRNVLRRGSDNGPGRGTDNGPGRGSFHGRHHLHDRDGDHRRGHNGQSGRHRLHDRDDDRRHGDPRRAVPNQRHSSDWGHGPHIDPAASHPGHGRHHLRHGHGHPQADPRHPSGPVRTTPGTGNPHGPWQGCLPVQVALPALNPVVNNVPVCLPSLPSLPGAPGANLPGHPRVPGLPGGLIRS